jgi:choline dehydrogenase
MRSFDYIIVGAGTAGCVLANRLTKNPSIRVLLVEAGTDSRDPRILTPSSYPLLNGTNMNWNFFSEPQKKLGCCQIECLHQIECLYFAG